MKHRPMSLIKFIVVVLFLSVGVFFIVVGGSGRSVGLASTAPQSVPTPTPQTGDGSDNSMTAPMIGLLGALGGAFIAGLFALMVPGRQAKLDIRRNKANLEHEAEKIKRLQELEQELEEGQKQQYEQEIQQGVRHYCEKLCKSPNIAKLQILGMGRALDIEDVYVHLRVHPDSVLRYELDPALREAEETHDPKVLLGVVQQYLERRMDSALRPDEAVRKHKRCVIVGDPGAGKTTLLKHLTLQSARGQLQGLPRVPIYIELSRFDPDKYSDLIEFAAKQWKEFIPIEDARTYIQEQMGYGNILLLLDGLDETTLDTSKEQAQRSYINAFEAIKKVAEEYPQSIIVVAVRKAAYRDQYRPKLSGFDELEVLDFRPEEIEHFVKNWFCCSEDLTDSDKEKKIRDLGGRLTRNPRIQALAANPLLLSLVVLVYEKHLDLPERRSELYKRCVETLLTEWDASRNVLRQKEFRPEHKQQLLKEIAWHFHNKGKRYFPEDELLSVIEGFLPAINLPAKQHKQVLHEIICANGLLKEQAEGLYGFSHLTLQEYFVSRYIVERSIVDRNLLGELLSHLGNEWWEEVLLLYACGVDDASPLLRALLGHDPLEPLQEDVFHTNLIRAGFCLATKPTIRDVKLRKEIVDRLFDTLQTTPYILVQDKIAEALAQAGGEEVNRRLLQLLSSNNLVTIDVPNVDVPKSIAYALGASGNPALAHELKNLLVDKHVESYVRARIARALGELGEHNVSNTLLDLLSNESEDWYIRCGAADALGRLGDASVAPHLIELLSNRKNDVSLSQRIAVALGRLKYRDVLPDLLVFLDDERMDSYVRAGIAEALAMLADEQVVPKFLQLLAEEKVESYVRKQIAKTLGTMGRHTVPTDKLLELLKNEEVDPGVRGSIASCLCALGEQGVVEELLQLLASKQLDTKTQSSVAMALGCLGNHDIIPKLQVLSLDSQLDQNVRACILATLGSLGARDVLPELLSILSDQSNQKVSQDVRRHVCKSLGHLGNRSMLDKSDIAFSLVTLLRNDQIDRDVRQSMAATLGSLGSHEVIPDMLVLLADESIDRYVRREIANVIARLAQGEQVVHQLAILLEKTRKEDILNDVYDALQATSRRTNVKVIRQGQHLDIVTLVH